MEGFIAMSSQHRVIVDSPDAPRLRDLLAAPDITITSPEPSRLEIDGITAPRVGEVAAAHGIVLHQLSDIAPSLEEAFMELTADSVTFHGSVSAEGAAA